MFLSIAGITINQEYLIAITINKTKDTFDNDIYSIVAILDGTKEEKTVPLVKGLDSLWLAEYIGEQIASIIDSDCDSQITKDELEGYISEYREMEEEFLASTEPQTTESQKTPTETNPTPTKNSNTIFVLSNNYYIPDLSQVKTRVTTIFPTNPFGNKTYAAEWSAYGVQYHQLETYSLKESAEHCATQFLEDIKSGQTTFDSDYFEQFETFSPKLFR